MKVQYSVKETFEVDTEFHFTSENANFVPQAEHNEFFIVMIERMYNDKLRMRGYVFLNEVLVALGIDPIPAGQLIGWTDDNFIHIEVKSSHYKGTVLKGYVLKIVTDGVILDKMMDVKRKELIDA